ncbi:MAG: triosephosphate isomerase [Deltaproteobacteria bacterium]|nr:MAG: triosephosphate isomerase [Deltaproteobacteria bacterium]
MNRTPLIAGNWKMHGARSEAVVLARALTETIGRVSGREVVIAPPFTALDPVGQVIAGSQIRLGAQNVHWEPKGAYTGEISTAMLGEAGCTYVIIGHSERRQLFGEVDETVNRRLHAALRAELVPIVCVGETLAERDADATAAIIERQVASAFPGASSQLVGLASDTTAGRVRILYGGSVKAANIDALMAEPDIDGALVGGASLDPAEFTRIVCYEETQG